MSAMDGLVNLVGRPSRDELTPIACCFNTPIAEAEPMSSPA
jgi:hypothetical protein